jgi:hypothetical protein
MPDQNNTFWQDHSEDHSGKQLCERKIKQRQSFATFRGIHFLLLLFSGNLILITLGVVAWP